MTMSGAAGGLATGKVPPAVLARLLTIPRNTCPELVVPPAPGEDAAVLRLGAGAVVVTSDPITFPTPRPGHFAVCVNANDVAAMGGRPRYFLLTLMLPPGSPAERVLGIVKEAVDTANAAGIVLIGGHTEVTAAVNWPVVSVTMFGELVAPAPLRTGGARAGDAIIQVGFLALEGTAILAAEHRDRLCRDVGEGVVEDALRRLDDPGISVVGPALRLAPRAEVHALHDPTEGGVATGRLEMAQAAGLGLQVEEEQLLQLPETTAICGCLGVDPLGLVSSGCLLAAVDAATAESLVADLRSHGYAAAVIGVFTGEQDLLLANARGRSLRDLPRFAVDELARE